MTTTTNVKQTKLNIMTQSQYNSATKNATELYMVTDAQISYNDLSNKPTIPTVNNATLTITQGGTTKGTFTANASSDVTIALDGGGSSRNIGEIVASSIPLTDAGLHLLDGTLISGSGSYADFVDYIAGLYADSDYAAIFETEANWQSAVTTYDVCGKFVYDSVNNTVRLPKYSNKIYTKDIASTAAVVGNGITLGLTDGTSNVGAGFNSSTNYLYSRIGAYNTTVGTAMGSSSAIDNGKTVGVTTDSTKSGIIADLANITTSLDGYYYIVIATSTKTDIQVDIDEIATDLNGKADVDLSNINASASAKNTIIGWGMPDYANGISVQGANSLANAYTAPCDGFIDCEYVTTNVAGLPNIDGVTYGCYNASSIASYVSMPINKGQKFYCTTIHTQHGAGSNKFYPLKGAS